MAGATLSLRINKIKNPPVIFSIQGFLYGDSTLDMSTLWGLSVQKKKTVASSLKFLDISKPSGVKVSVGDTEYPMEIRDKNVGSGSFLKMSPDTNGEKYQF